jgi:MFS family permease
MGSFDSLRYRDYRLLWTGAALSNVGSWMQSIGLAWYVYQLTGSAFWVAFTTFANFIPTVLSPVGGVYSDRFDRKTILLLAQTGMMLAAGLLAVLAWIGRANLTVVMVLTFAQGLAIGFNGPAWMSYVPSLVPPEALVNAIALNSAQFNLARVIGPAIAGPIVATSDRGPAIVFAINAVSFLAVLVALGRIRTGSRSRSRVHGVWDLLVGGLRYTWAHRRIRSMVVAIAVMSFFAAPANSLLPIFAAKVFGRDASGYGILAAAPGLGAVAGALILGRLGHRVGPAFVAGAMVGAATALALFAVTPSFYAGVALMFLYGASFLLFVSGNNSDVQLQVEEDMRGRVLSIWILAFGLAFPLGSLLSGLVAEAVGAQATTFAGAVACGAWGVVLVWRNRGPAAVRVLEPGS